MVLNVLYSKLEIQRYYDMFGRLCMEIEDVRYKKKKQRSPQFKAMMAIFHSPYCAVCWDSAHTFWWTISTLDSLAKGMERPRVR